MYLCEVPHSGGFRFSVLKIMGLVVNNCSCTPFHFPKDVQASKISMKIS